LNQNPHIHMCFGCDFSGVYMSKRHGGRPLAGWSTQYRDSLGPASGVRRPLVNNEDEHTAVTSIRLGGLSKRPSMERENLGEDADLANFTVKQLTRDHRVFLFVRCASCGRSARKLPKDIIKSAPKSAMKTIRYVRTLLRCECGRKNPIAFWQRD
jgi:hypothetical protein